MTAPDYVEPIVAWRVWHVVERDGALRLRSPLYQTMWPPRRELVAGCRPRTEFALSLLQAGRFGHVPPGGECGCGIYGGLTPRQATRYLLRFFKPRGDVVHRVLGTVALWGTVVQCERGWRSSFGYPVHIYVPVPSRRGWFHLARIRPPLLPAEEIVLGLADYGVPVELVECSSHDELAEIIEGAGVGMAEAA